MLRLPADLRDQFSEPLGPVHDDVDSLLAAVDRARDRHADGRDAPLLAVGDVVTYHLLEAGRRPDVAVVDGLTEREAVDEEVRTVLEAAEGDRVEVANAPATLSRELLAALREAVDRETRTTISVDGEEDLAALPAILVAPDGASVVYGQPGEGMVHVSVAPASRAKARTLFSRLDGDVEAALDALEASADG
jgi:hypothetical protein